jgi:hypothetical protein
MGKVLSVFESCSGNSVSTPVEYMDYQIERHSRMRKIKYKRGRVDIMEAS